MPAKRPPSWPPRAGSPVRNPDPHMLANAAARAMCVGSPKHKFGAYAGQVGRPGANPTTVEQAREAPPIEPFTIICPEKWNRRAPGAEPTELLRRAIMKGQIGHPIDADGLPMYVWARDPEDESIVYAARQLSVPSSGYKAYPLTRSQIMVLGMDVA